MIRLGGSYLAGPSILGLIPESRAWDKGLCTGSWFLEVISRNRIGTLRKVEKRRRES